MYTEEFRVVQESKQRWVCAGLGGRAVGRKRSSAIEMWRQCVQQRMQSEHLQAIEDAEREYAQALGLARKAEATVKWLKSHQATLRTYHG